MNELSDKINGFYANISHEYLQVKEVTSMASIVLGVRNYVTADDNMHFPN